MGLINGNMMLGSTILRRSSKRVTITYELKNCVSSNTVDTIAINSPYQTTIKSYDKLAYCGVQVLMGNKDISADVYDIYTGIININGVKSDIIIRAETLTTFADASWYAVKCVAQSNIMNDEEALYNLSWRLGDTKPLIIGEYTYNVRICDLTPNRYQYVNNIERYTNMVLECVELYPTQYPRHNQNNGNYGAGTVRGVYLNTLLPEMPNDLKQIIELINLPTFWYDNNKDVSKEKLFMPGTSAMGGDACEEEVVYQLYADQGVIVTQKHTVENNNYVEWWLRTGGFQHQNGYPHWSADVGPTVASNGNIGSQQQTGSSQPGNFLLNAKYIPIFWAW